MPHDLSNYVEVHVRIAQFWEKFPEGAIHTEIEYPDENTVRCRASIYRSQTDVSDQFADAPAAIGHAEERRDQGMVNKTSAVENCETSAVGRALALMGFSIHRGIASREEVEIAQRKASAQKNTPQAVTGPQNGSQAPVRLVDMLRGAIRTYNPSELVDDTEFSALVDSAKSKSEKARLVESLEAALVEAGGDPSLVRSRWEALRS